MFTWICPKCGREVLPSQSECPACEERAQAAAQAPAPPPAVPQQYAPPPQQRYSPPPVQQQPQYAPPQQYPPPPVQYGPPPSKGLPSWAVTLLVAGGLLAVGALAYRYLPSSKSASTETDSDAPPAKATNAKGAPARAHRYTKIIEVAGIRLTEDARQRLQIKLTVINHSAADLGGLKLLVTLSTKGKEAKTISEVPVTVANLGPMESKDVSATVRTKLRAIDLPDWQFMEASFQITEP